MTEQLQGTMDKATTSQKLTMDMLAVAERLTDQPAVEVAPGVVCVRIAMVNVAFIAIPETGGWVLVDAGIPHCSSAIKETAHQYFANQPPQAIILTHGHFDHVGAITELLADWDVPVYAHRLELPYLTGQADYPPADPAADGGLMAKLSPLYPREAINLGNKVWALPQGGTVPHLNDWQWIHTPGHTPGHISLFRQSDQTLVAGDAFVTVEQESAIAVVTQTEEVKGPPAYFTQDWTAAKQSVQQLAGLQPAVVVTGHGQPMGGEKLASQLTQLAQHFDELAVPENSRYSH